jgi:hypothetical protein
VIIPLWVDEKKDAALIKWLTKQTNRSAFIRCVLYDRMDGVKVEREVEIEDELMKCIDGLG